MKKVIVLIVGMLLVASTSFAATLTAEPAKAGGTLAATSPASLDIGKLSNNVYVGASYSATGYAISTYHKLGTKEYGTAYDATSIYFNDIGAGATMTAPTSSAADEAFNGWSKM